MSRRLYSSFQRSNHHQNESIKPSTRIKFASFVWCSPDCLNSSFELQVRCGENHPHTLARSSGRKVIESPTKKQAELHMVLFARATQPSVKADQLKKKAFAEVPTDRKPAPVMDAETIRAGSNHTIRLSTSSRAGFVIRHFDWSRKKVLLPDGDAAMRR